MFIKTTGLFEKCIVCLRMRLYQYLWAGGDVGERADGLFGLGKYKKKC